MVHGREDQPGYRYVCTLHWTRFGAESFATNMQHAARLEGLVASRYWAERRRPGDYPGRTTMKGRSDAEG